MEAVTRFPEVPAQRFKLMFDAVVTKYIPTISSSSEILAEPERLLIEICTEFLLSVPEEERAKALDIVLDAIRNFASNSFMGFSRREYKRKETTYRRIADPVIAEMQEALFLELAKRASATNATDTVTTQISDTVGKEVRDVSAA